MSTPSPKTALIYAYLQTRFATITVAAGYDNTVLSSRIFQDQLTENMPSREFPQKYPTIFINGGTEKWTGQPGGWRVKNLTHTVTLITLTDVRVMSAKEKLQRFIRDVDKCLYGDVKLGGLVTYSRVTDVVTDEGLTSPEGLAILELQTEFREQAPV